MRQVPRAAVHGASGGQLSGAGFEQARGAQRHPGPGGLLAPWCGPCRMMAPAYEQAARQLEPMVRVAKLNTEEAQTLAARLGIRSIPHLPLFHGRPRGRTHGRRLGRPRASWPGSAASWCGWGRNGPATDEAPTAGSVAGRWGGFVRYHGAFGTTPLQKGPDVELQRGTAVYYASKFQGRRTASGARLDNSEMVAAHPSLPFGCVVRVTNLREGHSADVTIVDRGPSARRPAPGDHHRRLTGRSTRAGVSR